MGGGHTRNREHGAALVEFAILAPLLIILVLGIVEFGWLFGQFNDIRHAAREGARFAAVDGGDANAIATRVCETAEGVSAGLDTLVVDLTDGATGTRGETAEISVTAEVGSLSNLPLITTFLPQDLTSDVTFRLEQDSSSWVTTAMIDAAALC